MYVGDQAGILTFRLTDMVQYRMDKFQIPNPETLIEV